MPPDPPYDPSALPKPAHEPPHDRFFEDGEEPPERYDQVDELDYVLPEPRPYDRNRWFRIALSLYHAHSYELASRTASYALTVFFCTFCTGGIFWLCFEPLFRGTLITFCMKLLTGNQLRSPETVPTAIHIGRLVFCQMPGKLAWLLMAFVPYMLTESLSDHTDRPEVLMSIVSISLICAVVIAYFHVRLGGFLFELAYDHDLSFSQALRGSWQVTRECSLRLTTLKLTLWLFLVLAGTLTFGIGLIFAIPYATLVWTAAYVDLAGSEPIRE